MKKACKAMLLAAFGLLAGVSAVQAQYDTVYPPGDLIIGFTTGAGTDVVSDLGKASALTNGMNWNLASLLTSYGNLSTVNWGVIGNTANTGSAKTAYTTTAVGVIPIPVDSAAMFTSLNTATKTIYQNFATAGAGQTASVPANNDISWNLETLNGSLFTDYLNVYENPNVQAATSCDFSQMLADGSNPTLLGRFTLAANGLVAYNTISSSPNPPTAGFTGTPTAGFAPLKVVFTDASTGSITNWLWNYGDGHSRTNGTSSNATNTYALAGTYTVTLTVVGPGGASTNVHTSYITVSPTPNIAQAMVSAGKFVLTGTNCPAGVQYRILSATNVALPLASWTPVATNTFLNNNTFDYTNSSATNARAFFRLVSP